MGWKLEDRSGAQLPQSHIFLFLTFGARIWRSKTPVEKTSDARNLRGDNRGPAESIPMGFIDLLPIHGSKNRRAPPLCYGESIILN